MIDIIIIYLYTIAMSTKRPINPISLESLIEDLDNRGLLVLQVLLGQQAMKLLTETTIKDKTSPILDTKGTNAL